jgi:predicted nucleic acid-binding protein
MLRVGRFAGHQGQASWATCPLTENGVIRIVGHTKYPSAPGSPADVAAIVAKMQTLAGHVFWPDGISMVSISIVSEARIDPSQILTSGQMNDTYLLALAAAHGGQLATFDRRLSTNAVRDGKAALRLITTT